MARGDGQRGCAHARRGACGAGGGAPPTQVDRPAQGPRCARPRAHAPGTQRPAPLSALACRSRYSPCPPVPLAGARWPRPQAPRMRGRGAGAARARASQAGWCLCEDCAHGGVRGRRRSRVARRRRRFRCPPSPPPRQSSQLRIPETMACIWSIVSDGSEVQLNGNC